MYILFKTCLRLHLTALLNVTLSVKTQLKYYFCDLQFSIKKIILHKVKNILWKCNLYIIILTD